jgi:hypothetical protein
MGTGGSSPLKSPESSLVEYSLFSEEHASLWGEALHNHLSALNPSLLVTLTVNEVEEKGLIDEPK